MTRTTRVIILLWISSVIIGTGCTHKFEDINSNPDKTSSTTAEALATKMLTSVTSTDIGVGRPFLLPFILSKYALYFSGGKEDLQYNKLGRTDGYARLAVLRNVSKMNEYAAEGDEGQKNAYLALGHFIRAWQFYQLTIQVGDIPYSEAIKGESDEIIKPKYDSQKDVILGVLNELDMANTLFAEGTDFAGDFIYNGNVDQWQRLTNSFELQVLMSLSRKTSDPDLKVVERFKDIVANRPLMRDYNDNFAVHYQNSAGYAYPWSNTPVQANNSSIYAVLGKEFVNQLKSLQDRRLFYYAEPDPILIGNGKTASDWDAYVGLESSDEISVTKAIYSTGDYSGLNKRYLERYDAEPVGLVNYWDIQFVLAEAAVRGWLPGSSAEAYYQEGITASMHFLAQYTPDEYTHNMPITDGYIATYLAGVPLTGNMNDKIKQIITQKYLAGFLQSCDDNAWYENRRTGYPAFVLNPATNENIPSTKFPLRWLYPTSELSYNSDNVSAAIQSQYGGSDDTNGVMWILQD